MTRYFQYTSSPFPIRQDIVDCYAHYWRILAGPGSWFTGEQRVAIAQEVRNALTCPFCTQRKTALSPYTMAGEHLAGTILSPEATDAVHRAITDQSRITAQYIQDNAARGLSEEHYVELLSVALIVLSIDEFHRALGLPIEALPEPICGEPDGYRPAHTEHRTGYVAMIPPEGAVGKESDLWQNGKTANVLRALSLVPDGVRDWQAVASSQYLSMKGMMNFSGPTGRSINRMQIELVAGRVSSINECFY